MALSENAILSTLFSMTLQRLYCCKMDRLDVLQKLDSFRDELLDIPKVMREQRETLLDVLRNSLVLATADQQCTLQAFLCNYVFLRNYDDKQHGGNRGTPPKKNSRRNLKQPVI